MLAFNRKAAEEIRQRLPHDLAGAHVATFHAFGRRVIADVEVAPTLSKLAEDEAMLTVVIDRILVDLVDDPRQSRVLADFITRHRADYRSQFEFDTPGQYYDYVRRSELRDAERRSGQELRGIGNRELPDPEQRQLSLRAALSRRDRHPVASTIPAGLLPPGPRHLHRTPRPGPAGPPAQGLDWVRRGASAGSADIHQRYGTRLIETYSWQQREGVLRHGLRQQLEEAGVHLPSASRSGRCSWSWDAG